MFEVQYSYPVDFLKAKAVVDLLFTITEETPERLTITATPYQPNKRHGFHLTSDNVYQHWQEGWAANIVISDVSGEILLFLGQRKDFNFPENTVKNDSTIEERCYGNNYYAAAEALCQWLCFGKTE